MKRIFYSAAALFLLSLAACKDAPKADEAKITEAKMVEQPATAGTGYKVDLQKSSVQWIGTKPTGRHHGTVMLKDGSLNIEDNNIKGGHFIIDLTTIAAYDDDNSANDKLQGHLKSADFFEVEKYGTAEFDITSVEAGTMGLDKNTLIMKDATNTVTGNLKIKEVTKSITFPAKISMADGKVIADAEFNIDRTIWGINYKSDKSLGDKVIHNEVNMKVHLEASK